jgi:hypothetical protein
MNKTIGMITNYIIAVIFLAIGLIYLFNGSPIIFMPEIGYVDNTESVMIGLTKIVSAGYLSISIAIFLLQKSISSASTQSIPLAILLSGLIITLISIYATLDVVYQILPIPIILYLILILLLPIGYFFNFRYLTKQ